MVFRTEELSKCLIMEVVVSFWKLNPVNGSDCLISTNDGSLHFSISLGSLSCYSETFLHLLLHLAVLYDFSCFSELATVILGGL